MSITAMLGMPAKTFLKRCTIASSLGLGCGQCVHNLKEHPGSTKSFIKYSAVGGFLGGIRGYCLGLWFGRGALTLILSQTMSASCATFAFFSIRSALANAEFVLPWHQEKEISEVLVTSTSGGITMATLSMLNGVHPKMMLSGLSLGLLLGFIGHIVYEQGRVLRLEFLLKHNYSDLVTQLKDAEDYMDEHQYSNPYYTGPVRATPWSDMAREIWSQLKREDDKILEESMTTIK